MTNKRLRRAWLFAAGLALPMLAASAGWAEIAVPEAGPRAYGYQQARDLFYLADAASDILIAAVFFLGGFAARLRTAASEIAGGRWFPTVSLTCVGYMTIAAIVGLPLAWAEDYNLPHEYGISTETLEHWLSDQAISLVVGAIVTGLVAWLPYLALRRRARDWWLWASAAAVPLLVLFVAVSPVLIAPLFNNFKPLTDTRLATALHAEASRVGLGNAPIFVSDQSTTSKVPTAYVNGLFGSSRIVLSDTLVNSFNEDEIKFVLGHEMKHYLLGDVWKLVGLFSIVFLAGFFLIDRFGRLVLRRFGERVGVTSLADPASFPILIAGFALAGFVLTPAVNLCSQSIEHEADRFGLELTRNNDAAAAAFVKLQKDGLGVPDPGFVQLIWRTNHPTLRDRIEFANTYHPWNDGGTLRYAEMMLRLK